MSGRARRSRVVVFGLSIGGLAGLVTGMAVTEHPRPAAPPEQPVAAPAPDPFAAGGPATPPSAAPSERARRTVTSAS